MKKGKIQFDAMFSDLPRGGEWEGLPKDLKEFFETPENSLRGIIDYLPQNKMYRVTVIFKAI